MCVVARREGSPGGYDEERREEREVNAPDRSLQVSLVRSPGVRGCTELHGFLARPTPPLRSAFAKSAAAGTTDAAAEAAAGGEDATAAACPSTARAAVRVPT